VFKPAHRSRIAVAAAVAVLTAALAPYAALAGCACPSEPANPPTAGCCAQSDACACGHACQANAAADCCGGSAPTGCECRGVDNLPVATTVVRTVWQPQTPVLLNEPAGAQLQRLMHSERLCDPPDLPNTGGRALLVLHCVWVV
jgi:hypothetical protein